MSQVVFFTKGDSKRGMGHLHRVGWLAGELKNCGKPKLDVRVVCEQSRQSKAFKWPAGVAVEITTYPLGAAAWLSQGDVAVIDWLDSTPVQVDSIKRTGAAVVLLDDYGPAREFADLVVNSLLAPLRESEETMGRARVVSGVKWVQLPPQAIKLRGVATATANALATELTAPAQPLTDVQCVLLSFGGSAVDRAVELSLEALRQARFAGRVVVIPRPVKIPSTIGINVEYLSAGDQFHDLLAASDMAVLAGGLSLYEAAFLGVPSLCLALKDHQLKTALKLERAGCCRSLGLLAEASSAAMMLPIHSTLTSAKLRQRLSAKGSRLIDGKGLDRTVTEILNLRT